MKRVALVCFAKQRRSTVIAMAQTLRAGGVEHVTIITSDPTPWLEPENACEIPRGVRFVWIVDREAAAWFSRTQRLVTHRLPTLTVRAIRQAQARLLDARAHGALPSGAVVPPDAADPTDEDDDLPDTAPGTGSASVEAPADGSGAGETPQADTSDAINPAEAEAVSQDAAPPPEAPKSRLGALLVHYRAALTPVQHALRPQLLASLSDRYVWPDLEPGDDLVVVACEPYAVTTVARLARRHPGMTALVSLDAAEVLTAAGGHPDPTT